jgi:deoxyribonuclease-4
MPRCMYGSHLSIAGGMVNALTEAKRLRVDCVQVFTKNQRQWKVTPLRDDDVAAWLEQLHAMGWDDPSGPSRVVSHNS